MQTEVLKVSQIASNKRDCRSVGLIFSQKVATDDVEAQLISRCSSVALRSTAALGGWLGKITTVSISGAKQQQQLEDDRCRVCKNAAECPGSRGVYPLWTHYASPHTFSKTPSISTLTPLMSDFVKCFIASMIDDGIRTHGCQWKIF